MRHLRISEMVLCTSIVAIALIAACAPSTGTPRATSGTAPTPTQTPIATPTPMPPSPVIVKQGGAVLSMVADTQVYRPGEKIFVTVSVENATSEPIAYTMWNNGDPAIYVHANSIYSPDISLEEDGQQPRAVLPVVVEDTLAPGASIKRKVVWDQLLNTSPDHIQAPSGIYTIAADFYIGGFYSKGQTEPMTAFIAVQIVGAGSLITQEEAKQIAAAVPEVRRWDLARSGANVVRQDNGIYYVLGPSGWEKASAEYAQAVMKEQPGSNVQMQAGIWEVTFYRKVGPPPYEISVRIDAKTGRVATGTQ